jgi:hypothetical protein
VLSNYICIKRAACAALDKQITTLEMCPLSGSEIAAGGRVKSCSSGRIKLEVKFRVIALDGSLFFDKIQQFLTPTGMKDNSFECKFIDTAF